MILENCLVQEEKNLGLSLVEKEGVVGLMVFWLDKQLKFQA